MARSRLVRAGTKFAAQCLRAPVGHKLLVACAVGIVAGWIAGPAAEALHPLGDLFIALLRLLVLPVVISTILMGLSSTRPHVLARVGGAIVGVYLATALGAAMAGVLAAALLRPGAGMLLPGSGPSPADHAPDGVAELVYTMSGSTLGNGGLVPVMLLSIVVALSIGWVRGMVSPARIAPLDRAIASLQRAVHGALAVVMYYAPIGVFALIAATVGGASQDVAAPLARVFASVYLGQAAVTAALLLLLVIASVPVGAFVSAVKVPLLTAFATGSSAATLPVEIESAGQRLRLERPLVAFALPLGTVINKTGTAVHLAVIASFASTASGRALSLEWGAALGVAAFVAACLTPPISGGSFVVMAGMLEDLGLPLTVIGLAAAIPFLGKLNTPVNSLGRLVATCVVAQCRGPMPAPRNGTPALDSTS